MEERKVYNGLAERAQSSGPIPRSLLLSRTYASCRRGEMDRAKIADVAHIDGQASQAGPPHI